MKLSDSKVLEIKSELYEKYEKELLKQRKFPNNIQTQGLKSKKYIDREGSDKTGKWIILK